MKLELKHLAPYLPYGLMVHCDFQDGDILTCKMEALGEHEAYLDGCDWNYKENIDFKPILRPLSDLTKEIDLDIEIAEIVGLMSSSHILFAIANKTPYNVDINKTIEINKLLFKNHFDVFGLIDKGLAININNITKP